MVSINLVIITEENINLFSCNQSIRKDMDVFFLKLNIMQCNPCNSWQIKCFSSILSLLIMLQSSFLCMQVCVRNCFGRLENSQLHRKIIL